MVDDRERPPGLEAVDPCVTGNVPGAFLPQGHREEAREQQTRNIAKSGMFTLQE
jgi:hypothetical protein